jgi:putative endonuclease
VPEPDSLLHEEDREAPRRASSEVGSRGESLAAEFLLRAGYRIVAANFTAPIGRNNKGVQVKGEIDIVALDGETLCFVEVKARSAVDFAGPLSNVDVRKQRVVTRTARVYRRLFNIRNAGHRFDVVTVVDAPNGEPEIELHRNFWSEGKFRKRNWSDEGF